MEAGQPAKRSRLRAALIVGAVFAMVLIATVGVTLKPLLFERNDYADTASIERLADYRDPALMKAAWQLPVAARYETHPYEFQQNPSFCGPASVSNVLHSLGVETTQRAVIDGTEYDPLFGVLLGGMTLDELADLLQQRVPESVSVLRGLSLEEFRHHMLLTNDPARRYVANFHRGPLFGRGHGHFSPILGYLVDRDLVLVGDVNESYRPFLVSAERLWQATDTVDSSSGKKRGLIVVDVAR